MSAEDNKVFLVIGDNGESYSDHNDWVVAAYTTREQADHHVKLCTDWFSEENPKIRKLLNDWQNSGPLSGWHNRPPVPKCPYDPTVSATDGGSNWYVEEVLYVRHPDEYLDLL